ncbi:uncharacterized protein LOC120802222 [Xiphias gladius]|uniref:uncharacterized protein LOC120802222 n=1 Tax=Xiphias gladius TaxID=8245 RepID=UPI001A994C05|nr:uncharacterized protein LOC120802222 [Xiphias gladius]XP_040005728.1 uncharacterized protein LOC120802222 [Xiphias gladius]
MGRNKCRLSRDSGLRNKPDTPVKPGLSRRDKHRRLLPNKHYEAFPEEPEVEEIFVPTVKPTSPVWSRIKPVQCNGTAMVDLSSPAYTENPRHKAYSPATPPDKKPGYQVSPAWHPTIQMTPDPEAFKGGEMLVKEEEESLAVTPESIASSSMETDTTFNFNDDEEDCYSSTSSSSSIPSPEIFRKENYVERMTFPTKEELLGLHLHIKNSTLLDVSHAETIHMHHPPNFSTIIDASTILAENNCEISNHRGPEAETKIQADALKSDNQAQAFKLKTPAKVRQSPGYLLQLTTKRPILCKKKVSFKTPIISEIFEANHIPATKLTIHNARESVKPNSLAEQIKPDAETSRADEINSKDDTLHLSVTLKRPVKSCVEKAKFFDFVSDSDRDVFFQRMRERCVKLRSTPVFPLTAAKHTEASVLSHLKPKYYV